MNNRGPLFVVLLTVFIDLLGFGIIIPILPNLAVSLGGSANALAIAAIYAATNFLFSPFWGTLSDRYGRRPIILISILITALANLSFAMVGSLAMLMVQRALAGMGSANISAANAYIADISEPKDRAKNMGMVGAAFGLGFIFGPLIGGYLKTHYGIVGVGLVSGGLSFFNLILAYFQLKESLPNRNRESKLTLDPISPLIKAMKQVDIRRLFIVNFIFIAAFSLMQITVAVLWTDHFLLNEAQIGYMFAYMGLTTALIQGFLVGPLNKAYGEKKLLMVGFLVMILGVVSLPYYTSVWGELIGLAAIALANGMISPSILSLLSAMTSAKEQGKILGLNQSLGSLGRVAGPVMGGPLYAWHYQAPYLGGALILFLALALTVLMRKHLIRKD